MNTTGTTENYASIYSQQVAVGDRIWAIERMGRVLAYLKAIQADDLAKKAAELGDAITALPPPGRL